MIDYKKVYFDYFGYKQGDFVPSELSGEAASDIHHIHRRGMGGDKTKPRIENLIALTREEHTEYGDLKHYKAFLYKKHLDFLFEANFKTNFEFEDGCMKYDNAWLLAQIYKYEFTCVVCKAMNCLDLDHLKVYSNLLRTNIK